MDEAIQQLLTALLTAIGTVVAGFAVAALHKFRQKVGLQADAEQDAKVRAAVQNAILATEERLRAEAKRRISAVTGAVNPDIKMTETVAHVMDKLPELTVSEAATLVNEELPKVRALEAPPVFPAPVDPAAAPPK